MYRKLVNPNSSKLFKTHKTPGFFELSRENNMNWVSENIKKLLFLLGRICYWGDVYLKELNY